MTEKKEYILYVSCFSILLLHIALGSNIWLCLYSIRVYLDVTVNVWLLLNVTSYVQLFAGIGMRWEIWLGYQYGHYITFGCICVCVCVCICFFPTFPTYVDHGARKLTIPTAHHLAQPQMALLTGCVISINSVIMMRWPTIINSSFNSQCTCPQKCRNSCSNRMYFLQKYNEEFRSHFSSINFSIQLH